MAATGDRDELGMVSEADQLSNNTGHGVNRTEHQICQVYDRLSSEIRYLVIETSYKYVLQEIMTILMICLSVCV